MKKLFLLFVFVSSFVFGQKSIHFDYEVEYQLINKKTGEIKEDIAFKSLVSSKNGVNIMSIIGNNYYTYEYLFYRGRIYMIKTFFNNINFYKPKRYYSRKKGDVIEDIYENLVSLHQSEKVQNINCEIFTSFIEKKNEKVKIWIAKNHSVNNVLSFKPKNAKDKIKGLITRFEIDGENEALVMKSYQPIDVKVNFDLDKEVKKYNENATRLEEEYLQRQKEREKRREEERREEERREKERREKERKKAIEQTVESATDAVEQVAVKGKPIKKYKTGVQNVFPYKSKYKKRKSNSPNLAIDNLNKNNSYWQQIPTYCKKIDQELPHLKNKTYQKELKNYAGQICDLYMHSVGSKTIDVRGTIDEIRRSDLYFQNHYEKLKKSDQRKVKKFFNNLD
ncbi:MAG: hypothetical protein CSA38_02895 [Flavobacteriales bacterium]|nr:MAG: hypothetical protein CSA38_02895 [Flavobacteriales bacterium]